MAEVAVELQISEQTIYTWCRQARIDAGIEAGLTTSEKAELASARRARRSHRLPSRDLVARAQARSLRALPLPGGALPHTRLPRGVRRVQGPRGERADVEYLRTLHLAASTMESTVERALVALLAEGRSFTYHDVKERAAPHQSRVPDVKIGQVDLDQYDELLGGAR